MKDIICANCKYFTGKDINGMDGICDIPEKERGELMEVFPLSNMVKMFLVLVKKDFYCKGHEFREYDLDIDGQEYK